MVCFCYYVHGGIRLSRFVIAQPFAVCNHTAHTSQDVAFAWMRIHLYGGDFRLRRPLLQPRNYEFEFSLLSSGSKFIF